MMSESDAPPLAPKQYRVVKVSTAMLSLVSVVLIVAVGELFLLRAASRHDVTTLACYVVRYSPDSDPTAKEIRHAYHCPPARSAPGVSVKLPPPRRSAVASVSAPVAAVGSPVGQAVTSSVPRRSSRPAAVSLAPSSSARPGASPTASRSGLLGGLLCNLQALPICRR